MLVCFRLILKDVYGTVDNIGKIKSCIFISYVNNFITDFGNYRGLYRGGRGGFRGGNRDGERERPAFRGGRGGRSGRQFERLSGSDRTGVKALDRKDGFGKGNWGTDQDEMNGQNEQINGGTTGTIPMLRTLSIRYMCCRAFRNAYLVTNEGLSVAVLFSRLSLLSMCTA